MRGGTVVTTNKERAAQMQQAQADREAEEQSKMSPDELLRRLSHKAWQVGPCPDSQIITLEKLKRFCERMPEDRLSAFQRFTRIMVLGGALGRLHKAWIASKRGYGSKYIDPRVWVAEGCPPLAREEAVEFPNNDHPLLWIVNQWQKRAFAVEPFRPVNRASIPRLDRAVATDRMKEMPTIPAVGAEPEAPQQTLIAGVIDDDTPCPSWLLQLYDAMGGPLNTQGQGAPWALRLCIGALLHLPINSRDGEWHTLRFPLVEDEKGNPGVERWLHPNGWDRSNRRKYWHRLPEALHFMREKMGWLRVEGIGWVQFLSPSVIPSHPDDPLVEFTIRVPTASAYGDRIDWERLCRYGQRSAAQYRAYLAASAFMGQSAHNGNPLTRQIAAPVLRADGRPARRKGGRIIRNAGKLIDNPYQRYVRGLTDRDLASMIGFDPNNRVDRQRAREAFEKLHEDGALEFVKDGGLWRLFGPKG